MVWHLYLVWQHYKPFEHHNRFKLSPSDWKSDMLIANTNGAIMGAVSGSNQRKTCATNMRLTTRPTVPWNLCDRWDSNPGLPDCSMWKSRTFICFTTFKQGNVFNTVLSVRKVRCSTTELRTHWFSISYAGDTGVEPAPYCVTGRYLNRLTYRPIMSVWVDLNHRPPSYQDGNLTNWYTDRTLFL